MLAAYFDCFFTEKALPVVSWELQDHQGTTHIINSEIIIAAIKAAPQDEQEYIRDILVKIDFANGDVLHFLKHLAQGLVNLWAEAHTEGDI